VYIRKITYLYYVVERPTSLPPPKDMLFNSPTSLVRIKFYSDTDRGYGDAGTFRYVKVSENEFEKNINIRRDGSTYDTYEAKPELLERLEGLGYNYYSMGFEFATEEEYTEELTKLREKLERLENIF